MIPGESQGVKVGTWGWQLDILDYCLYSVVGLGRKATMNFGFGAPNTTSPEVGKRVRILAVDDSEEFRHILKDIFDDKKFDVITIGGSVKALELYAHEKDNIDLVLLDYFMPQLDGVQTLEWMRKLNPNVKIIICSGADALLLRRIVAECHADGYVQKPFSLQELRQQIEDVIQKLGLAV